MQSAKPVDMRELRVVSMENKVQILSMDTKKLNEGIISVHYKYKNIEDSLEFCLKDDNLTIASDLPLKDLDMDLVRVLLDNIVDEMIAYNQRN